MPTWLIVLLMFNTVIQIAWCVLYEVWKRETRDHLAEVQRCNEEFAESLALLRYGALDEAIEVALRWKERVK